MKTPIPIIVPQDKIYFKIKKDSHYGGMTFFMFIYLRPDKDDLLRPLELTIKDKTFDGFKNDL